MTRLLGLVLFAAAMLLNAPAVQARTEGGDLLWEADFDATGGPDRGTSVAVANGRVVVVGSAQNAAGDLDVVVRAHATNTGVLLWEDRAPLGLRADGAVAAKAVMDGQHVVVAGNGVDSTGATPRFIRVYVSKTGLLLWQLAEVGDIILDGPRTVVAGTALDSAAVSQVLVRSYVTQNGAIAWVNHSPLPSGYEAPGGAVVAVEGGTVFVTAVVHRTVPTPAFECLVRAYDSSRGILLWQTIHNLSGSGVCFPGTIASDGKRVVIGGLGGVVADDYFVLAFDANTGAFAWQDHQRIGNNEINVAVAVDAAGRQAFVAGWLDVPTPGAIGGSQEAFVVRSYDTKTGALRWEDHLTGPVGVEWHALDVDAAGGRVFAVGQNKFMGTWLVRAYNSKQGDLLWEDEFQRGGPSRDSGGRAVTVNGGRVFVAGSGFNAAGNLDIILRAYDAK